MLKTEAASSSSDSDYPKSYKSFTEEAGNKAEFSNWRKIRSAS